MRSAVQADAALIDAARNIRVIGRAGVGVDNIDVEVATRRGIVVMNAPGASAVSVSELTLGLMLAMARHISARRPDDSRREVGEEKLCREPSWRARRSASSASAGSERRRRRERAPSA